MNTCNTPTKLAAPPHFHSGEPHSLTRRIHQLLGRPLLIRVKGLSPATPRSSSDATPTVTTPLYRLYENDHILLNSDTKTVL